ncbi:MAG: hypothetical protein JRJ26_11310 [Deltaproteobacteria bacterium]|nr:hypothetical protein [Deltaproteobacteria bacterium]
MRDAKRMKKGLFVLALVVGLAFFAVQAEAQMGPGMMGPGYGTGPGMMGPRGGYGGWWYCPWCGRPIGPGGYGMGPGMMGRGMGPGMMGPGYGMGPGMMGRRGYGMGPGMMGRGYGMGPGMMGPGYGMGPGMMGPGMMGRGYGPEGRQPEKPMGEKDAKRILENYLNSLRNPNLKLGRVEDKGNVFEAEIVTKDGSLVDKILVDKNTGWMRSAY